MKNILFALLISTLSFSLVYSQTYSPVKWEYSAKKVSETEVELHFVATIDNGWKLFSQTLESDQGPVATSFTFHSTTDYNRVGTVNENEDEQKTAYDDVFEMNVVWYEGSTTFVQRVEVANYNTIVGQIEYMVCNKDRCLPPEHVPFEFDISKLGGTMILGANNN